MKVKIGNKIFEVSKEELESNPNEITINFDGNLRTEEEEVTFIENHKKDARKEGLEIAVKQYREEFGFEGRSIDKLIEAVKSKTLEDAQIEPTEQLRKIKSTLEEKETALQSALARVGEGENAFKSYKNETKLDRQLDGFIPQNTILPKEDIKMIIKNKLKFDFDESGNILALDSMGNIIKDATTANPKQAKEVIENFFKDNQNYLKPIEGGSGEGDSSSKGKKKSIDDFIADQKAKGNNPNSEAFNTELQNNIKEGLVDVD